MLHVYTLHVYSVSDRIFYGVARTARKVWVAPWALNLFLKAERHEILFWHLQGIMKTEMKEAFLVGIDQDQRLVLSETQVWSSEGFLGEWGFKKILFWVMGWKVDGGHFPQCLDGKGWWIHDDTLRTNKKQKHMWTSWRPKNKYSLWRWFENKSGLDWYCSLFQSLFCNSFFFSWRQFNCQLHLWCFFLFALPLVSHGFTPTETNENKTTFAS